MLLQGNLEEEEGHGLVPRAQAALPRTWGADTGHGREPLALWAPEAPTLPPPAPGRGGMWGQARLVFQATVLWPTLSPPPGEAPLQDSRAAASPARPPRPSRAPTQSHSCCCLHRPPRPPCLSTCHTPAWVTPRAPGSGLLPSRWSLRLGRTPHPCTRGHHGALVPCSDPSAPLGGRPALSETLLTGPPRVAERTPTRRVWEGSPRQPQAEECGCTATPKGAAL